MPAGCMLPVAMAVICTSRRGSRRACGALTVQIQNPVADVDQSLTHVRAKSLELEELQVPLGIS